MNRKTSVRRGAEGESLLPPDPIAQHAAAESPDHGASIGHHQDRETDLFGDTQGAGQIAEGEHHDQVEQGCRSCEDQHQPEDFPEMEPDDVAQRTAVHFGCAGSGVLQLHE
jgi:hypothetical protein